MITLKPEAVPCPVCQVAAGNRCRYVKTPDKRGQIMRFGHHLKRRYDADDAARAANVLIDS